MERNIFNKISSHKGNLIQTSTNLNKKFEKSINAQVHPEIVKYHWHWVSATRLDIKKSNKSSLIWYPTFPEISFLFLSRCSKLWWLLFPSESKSFPSATLWLHMRWRKIDFNTVYFLEGRIFNLSYIKPDKTKLYKRSL